jgi:hypothetical protein
MLGLTFGLTIRNHDRTSCLPDWNVGLLVCRHKLNGLGLLCGTISHVCKSGTRFALGNGTSRVRREIRSLPKESIPGNPVSEGTSI